MNFSEFNLNDDIVKALSYMGFENATPVQEQVIPVILEGRDLIACAQTGTGKTAAYVLPVLNKLADRQRHGVDTLIIVPTRELAIQIEQQIQGFAYFISAGSIAIYGGGDGADWDTQKNALKKGVDIVVATPGKLLSHLKTGDVKFDHVRHFVLDEADRMLDMGFIDDIRAILSYLTAKHQTLMFSATMPKSIRQLAQKILHHPVEVSLAVTKPVESVDQKAFLVYEEQKAKMLACLLADRPSYDSILVFTATKNKVYDIVRSLNRNGYPARGISSNLDQDSREEVLGKFRARRIRILVATNVVSRGIDVKEINLVINYDVPHDAEDYVHRIGRTARVNATGEAITLVTPKESGTLSRIERLIDSEIPKIQPPAAMGTLHEWKESVRKPNSRKDFHRGRHNYRRKGPKEQSKG